MVSYRMVDPLRSACHFTHNTKWKLWKKKIHNVVALLKYAFKASPFPKPVAKRRQTSVSKYEDKIIVVAIFKF